MGIEFQEMLAHVTGGRRYCFVIMSWHERYAFFEGLRRIVAEETGWECIRADDIPQTGDLRAKIHAAIDNAALVIADITKLSPNIYYEIGYAAARAKPLLILATQGTDVPTNLQGLELIQCDVDTKQGFSHFEERLRHYLRPLGEPVSLLRAMIVPPKPHPSYILVNPKQPTGSARRGVHPAQRRTYGDYLGVTGIFSVFGALYGEELNPELLTASRADPHILEEDASFYIIGSNKVNPFTSYALELLQQGKSPNWHFDLRSEDKNKKDPEWPLWRMGKSGREPVPKKKIMYRPGGTWRDYGLFIRGPHPRFSQRMLTVLAGPHALGTGAACLAATRTEKVKQIREKLETYGIDLAACDRTLWALVEAEAGPDLHLYLDNVEVLEVGVIE